MSKEWIKMTEREPAEGDLPLTAPLIYFEDYHATRDGRIFSNTKQGYKSHYLGDNGYWYLFLHRSGRRHREYVHGMICEAFHGGRPDGMECAHLDGNRNNNSAINLAWVTPKENSSHKRMHKTLLFGENQPRAKLSNDQAKFIFESGLNQQELAAMHGVSRQTISDIKTGRRWSSITGMALRARCTP